MGYEKAQRIYLPGSVDLGANSPYVWLPADDMVVYGFGLYLTEAPHATTVTTSAVVTMAYDAANAGTTAVKGTLTVGVAGDPIGKEYSEVTVVPFNVDASAGDAVEWTLTTAIGATTTTGVATPFVLAEIFPALTGAA